MSIIITFLFYFWDRLLITAVESFDFITNLFRASVFTTKRNGVAIECVLFIGLEHFGISIANIPNSFGVSKGVVCMP